MHRVENRHSNLVVSTEKTQGHSRFFLLIMPFAVNTPHSERGWIASKEILEGDPQKPEGQVFMY